ncbi:MAG: hypothetical protein O7A63_06170, partial [Acidobacteria bacterium]|nr:hypothetical protein [Acidobacteriota bacterium]
GRRDGEDVSARPDGVDRLSLVREEAIDPQIGAGATERLRKRARDIAKLRRLRGYRRDVHDGVTEFLGSQDAIDQDRDRRRGGTRFFGARGARTPAAGRASGGGASAARARLGAGRGIHFGAFPYS